MQHENTSLELQLSRHLVCSNEKIDAILLMYCLYRCGPVKLTSILSLCIEKPKGCWCCVEWVAKTRLHRGPAGHRSQLLLGSFLDMCKGSGFRKQESFRLVPTPGAFPSALLFARAEKGAAFRHDSICSWWFRDGNALTF